MQTIFVQFSSPAKTDVGSVFGCAQDPAVWPNQGQIRSDDSRYAAYYDAIPVESRAALTAPSA